MSLSNAPVINLAEALEPDALAAWLADQFAQREARGTELLTSYKRFLKATAAGIPDDTTAGKATDFARMLKAEVKEIDATRTAIKEPVLAATRQIDGVGRRFAEPLVAAMTEVEKRVTAFLRVKEQEARRLAAEEAAKREAEAQVLLDQAQAADDPEAEEAIMETAEAAFVEAEAAQAIVAAKPADLTRMRTQAGTTAALKDNWVFAGIVDMSLVPVHYLMVNEQLIRAAVRSGVHEIPGLRIENQKRVSVR